MLLFPPMPCRAVWCAGCPEGPPCEGAGGAPRTSPPGGFGGAGEGERRAAASRGGAGGRAEGAQRPGGERRLFFPITKEEFLFSVACGLWLITSVSFFVG